MHLDLNLKSIFPCEDPDIENINSFVLCDLLEGKNLFLTFSTFFSLELLGNALLILII